MYGNDTVFIIGDARTQEDNPITYKYSKFFIALVVNKKNWQIADFQCSSVLDITDRFLKEIFISKNIKFDLEKIEREIEERYFGSSKRAIIVAMKDAVKKINSMQ